MNDAVWQIDQLLVRGSHRSRLQSISLDIHAGVTAISGPSGAGKTTLLNVLVGFEVPDAGTVVFHSSGGGGLFWAPADHGLWPHLSVRQHVEVVMPRDDAAAADRLLADFDLRDHADHRPERLSQGQRSRLAVARCLASGAKVLVMDEPLVHVDEARLERFWAIIRQYVQRHEATLVFSSHHTAAVLEQADRVIYLDEGRVTFDGPVTDFRNRSVHPQTSAVSEPKPAPHTALQAAPRLATLLLLALCLGFAGCDGGAEAALPMAAVEHHSMPPDGAMVPAPRSIAMGRGGEMIVLDNAGRVLVFDRDMNLLRQWRMPDVEVGKPEGVCLLADGRIAIADTHYSRVVFFDLQGRVLSMLGEHGEGSGQFIYPVKVVQDPAGHIYVAEYGSNDRVQKFTVAGEHLLSFGSFGTGEGQFQRPSGLVWHAGRVYVGDAVNNRVQVFTDDGAFVGTLEGDAGPVALKFPYDLAMGPHDLLHVIEYGAGRVTVLTLDGELVGRFGSAGSGPGQFATPWGLAVDDRGVIWVADTGNRRIVELRP